MSRKNRIKEDEFGYEFDVQPEELTFMHGVEHDGHPGCMVVKPPEGKRVGLSYSKLYEAAPRLHACVEGLLSNFPQLGTDEELNGGDVVEWLNEQLPYWQEALAIVNGTPKAQTEIIQPPALDHDAMMEKRFGKTVSPTGRLERRLVVNLIAHLQRRGFSLCSVHDGENETKVSNAKEAMELLFNLDEAHMYVRKRGRRAHWVYFVFGNGIDLVSDYSYYPDDKDGFRAAMEEFNPEVYA